METLFFQQQREQMETELLRIKKENPQPELWSAQSIPLVQQYLTGLKSHLVEHPFRRRSEEIQFFKEMKPRMLGRLLYFVEVFNFSSNCPCSGKYPEKKAYWIAKRRRIGNSTPYGYVLNLPIIATDPTGMDTHLEGEAAQEFFTLLQQEQQESNLDGDQLDQQAQSIMEDFGGESDENFTIDAILPVYQSITPDIYKHIKGAQLSGYPAILTRGASALSDFNRRKAFKERPFMEDQPVRPQDAPFSVDEYPFASTEEGGLGASLMWVPKWEQDIQSNQLSSLYAYVKQGDKFLVLTISSDEYPYTSAPAWRNFPEFKPSDFWIRTPDNVNPPPPGFGLNGQPQVFPPWAIPVPLPIPALP